MSGHGRARPRGPLLALAVVVGVLATGLGGWVGWLVAEPGAGASATSTGPSPSASPSASAAEPSPGLAATPTSTPTPTPTPTPTGLDLTLHSTTDPESIWVVVNKQRPVSPLDWAPSDLVDVGPLQLRAEAAEHLQAMLDAAAAEDVRIGLRTGYRSYGQQASIRADLEARKGYEHAERYSARPGYSEHQTGLALDVDSPTHPGCDLKLCFADTVEGRWVAAHAGEYGFVLRYTDANAEVTGFGGEPWHLRYVGPELVEHMATHGLTSLEETFDVTGGWTYNPP